MKKGTSELLYQFLDQIKEFEDEIYKCVPKNIINEYSKKLMKDVEILGDIVGDIIKYIFYLTIKGKHIDNITDNEKYFFIELLEILKYYSKGSLYDILRDKNVKNSLLDNWLKMLVEIYDRNPINYNKDGPPITLHLLSFYDIKYNSRLLEDNIPLFSFMYFMVLDMLGKDFLDCENRYLNIRLEKYQNAKNIFSKEIMFIKNEIELRESQKLIQSNTISINNNSSIDDVIINGIEEIVANAKTQLILPREEIINIIDNIYLPIFEKFKSNLDRHNIKAYLERSADSIAESIELELENNGGETLLFEIHGYFSVINYLDEKVEKPFEVLYNDFNQEYSQEELTQDLLIELILKFLKICNITKVQNNI